MRKFLTLLVMVVFTTLAMAQNKTVTGKVTDEKGAPVANASVLVKGTTKGVTTGSDGSFSLSVPNTAKTLIVSSVNFTLREVSIKSVPLNITLQSSISSLDEVVIVGYQSVKKREVIGAVATVSGKELADKPIASFLQNLQGKAPGVQVFSQSGRPGSNPYIRIRGTGSINASNEPFVVIDGIAASTVAFNMLNPNDIDDVTVLKDAAASAIYGSRAGNGVLVVTTKKGKAGKPELRYSFQYGKSSVQELKNVTLMNSQEKLQYEYEFGYTNPILDSMITNRIASGAFTAGSTLSSINATQRQSIWDLATSRGAGDWRKYLLTDAPITKQEVSLSGGSDKSTYYFSLNKRDETGTLYGNYFNGYGGRLNFETKALDWLKLGVNLGLTYTKDKQVRELFNSQNAYAATFLYNPYEPLLGSDGKPNNTFQGFSAIEGADNNPNILNRISTFSTFFAEAKALKHLTLKTQMGINYNTLRSESYLQPGSNLATILGYSQKADGGNSDFLYVFTNTASWNQSLGKHNFNILAGTEFTKDAFYSYSLTNRNFPTASVVTLDNGALPTAATTSRSDYSLISYFASAAYDYNKKYFLTLSGRRDGSSRFGKDVRYANFWSIGGSWDIRNEEFLKAKFVSTLRLRASLGIAGNQPTGLYTSLGTYSLAAKYNDLPAATPNQLPNQNFTWETNRNYDFGLEFGFFNNRITGTVDYYNRETQDLIYPVNVSTTTGFSSFTGNVGNIVNKGIEFAINGDVIKNKDFTWNVGFTYTHNDNKILKLYSDNVTQTLSKFKVGEPINTFFMVKWAGVDPANGKNLYYNLDGTTTTTYSASQAQLLNGKSPIAKYFGSVNTTLSYKGFDLSAQLYYTGGNYIMNYVYQVAANNGEDVSIPQFTEASNYWKKPGDVTRYTNLSDPTQYITYDTDQYLEKGDYFTLRDVVIGYNLPANVANKIKMKGLRFYVQGTNLFLSTKYHGIPEVGQANSETSYVPGQATLYGYPQVRAFTIGASIRF